MSIKSLNLISGLAVWTASATFALGASAGTEHTWDFGLSLKAGAAFHKSEAAGSNDSSISTDYEIFVHGGKNANVGMVLSNSSMSTSFGLVDSKYTAIWEDVTIYWQLWESLAIGAVVMQGDHKVELEGNLEGWGVGFGTGFMFRAAFEVGRNGRIFVEGMTGSLNTVHSLDTDKEIDITDRQDMMIGGSIALGTKYLRALFGVKTRSWNISIDGTSSKEETQAAVLGLSTGLNF